MGVPVHTVEIVRVEFITELMGRGRNVKQGVAGTGYGGVHHDGIFKGFHRYDIGGFKPGLCQLYRLYSGIVGRLLQIFTGGRHQSGARKHETQRFGHYLHGGSRSHEGAGAAGGTGVLLVPGQLVLCDFPSLAFGAVHSDLLQREEVGTGVHNASGYDDRRKFQPPNRHQMSRNRLVTASYEDTRVECRGVCMDFDHVADGVPGSERVVDPVVSLCHAVADIGGKIPCSLASAVIDSFHRFFYEP